MNAQEIYHDRIEEAAFQESSMYDTIQEKNAAYSTGMKIANFALQNQWISVEEALPEDNGLYFVAYKAMDKVLYSIGYYGANYEEWYVDGYGYMSDVSYWMHIPQPKGGE